MQCQGGAKNPIVVLPDADMETTVKIVADSAFGCAGQRCLASSLAVTVGNAAQTFTEAIADVARSRRVGYGLEADVEMGPVISHASRERIESLIAAGTGEGARAIADGRNPKIAGYEQGSFVRPTVLQNLPATGDVAKTEIFGPVLGTISVNTLDDAIALINNGAYGNMACLFTTNGASARQFRYEVDAGNVGGERDVLSRWRRGAFARCQHGQRGNQVAMTRATASRPVSKESAKWRSGRDGVRTVRTRPSGRRGGSRARSATRNA